MTPIVAGHHLVEIDDAQFGGLGIVRLPDLPADRVLDQLLRLLQVELRLAEVDGEGYWRAGEKVGAHLSAGRTL